MKKFCKSLNIYRLILIIFAVSAFIKVNSQLTVLDKYNEEISMLNEKISVAEKQIEENKKESTNTKENIEENARKNLKMYYPNETPYKGY